MNSLFGFQFQSPGPIVFEIGFFAIRWYGLLISSSVLIGVALSQWLATKRRVNPHLVADLVIWLVIFAIPCARLYYVIFEWQQYAQNPGDIIAIWKGGIAIHGAIIGGTLATIIFARLNRVSVWQLTDLIVPSLTLGQAIGRWGNFFNSEAFGPPTNLPWKLYIPVNHRPLIYINQTHFHPTFLYESIWNILVFILLLILFFVGLKHVNKIEIGTLSLVYLIAYGFGRFWIEGLRTDSLMLGSIRIAQLVSIMMIGLGTLGLIWLYKAKRTLPDVHYQSTKNIH
ncbi:prolipoprotein diacylglyceryl transferase [Cyanobacterium sp. uoEpiScrs1]|uniref:prolipoprotein diacylglyceryl transferase n=1 Tax=Cyanobacterium sp. uoEpiScrs1 TaxID=2976343 RepID=UPI00226AF899|nr:prolipoprotein diacylglyceryl transferase [Cyanobacterium sp. uoEpiScrs1]